MYQFSAQNCIKHIFYQGFTVLYATALHKLRISCMCLTQPLCLLPTENRLIPTELRREALALQGSLEFDDAGGEGDLPCTVGQLLSLSLGPTGFRVIAQTLLRRGFMAPAPGPLICALTALHRQHLRALLKCFRFHLYDTIQHLSITLGFACQLIVLSPECELCRAGQVSILFTAISPAPSTSWHSNISFITLFKKCERNRKRYNYYEGKESVNFDLNRI